MFTFTNLEISLILGRYTVQKSLVMVITIYVMNPWWQIRSIYEWCLIWKIIFTCKKLKFENQWDKDKTIVFKKFKIPSDVQLNESGPMGSTKTLQVTIVSAKHVLINGKNNMTIIFKYDFLDSLHSKSKYLNSIISLRLYF